MTESEFNRLVGGYKDTQKAATPTTRKDSFDQMWDQGMQEKDEELANNPETASIFNSFKSGLLRSSAGLPIKHLWGLKDQLPKKEQGYIDHFARLAGEVIGDIPAFAAGSNIGTAVGGIIGGAVGSVIPGVGTVAGAGGGGIVGAGAGMMALPAMVKEAFHGYEKYVDQGGKESFFGFLHSLSPKEIAKSGAKSAAVGSLFGVAAPQLAKSLPLLNKVPGMAKLLKTTPGQFVTQKAMATAALTGAESAVNLELPTGMQLLDNSFMTFGFGMAESIKGKAKAYAGRALLEPKTSPAEVKVATQEAKLKAKETQVLKEKGPALEFKQKRIEAKKQRIAAEKKRIAESKERAAKIEKATTQAKYDIMSDMVKKIVPEAIGGEKLAKKIKGTPKSKEKTAKLRELLVENAGEAAAKLAESKYEWDKTESDYTEKNSKLTKQQGEDIVHYMQETGNPRIKGDTFKDVQKRMSEPQRELAKKFRTHFQESLKENNENPIMRDINPREAVEEYYWPGMWEEAPSKVKSVYDKAMQKLKIKNPAADTKSFITVADAMEKGGLTPKYSNPFDMMRVYDKQRFRIEADTKVRYKIEELQKETGDEFFANPKSDVHAAELKAKGYKEFHDPLLRSVKGKDGKYTTTKNPALVSPEFANEMYGVFTKEAYSKPDHIFWRGLAKVRRNINIARVAISPFHYLTQLENIRGQLGLGRSFQLMDLASKGRALAKNKEFMMRSARAQLQHGSLEALKIKKGGSQLLKGIEYFAGEKVAGTAETALNKMKKGMGYLHEEFIPNIKRVAFEETLRAQEGLFEKQHGRKLTSKESLKLDRLVAEQINNVFGGQNWAESKFFKTAKNRRILRRLIAFPDWTISNIKQAMGAFKPGTAGQMGRKYLVRYIMRNAMLAGTARAFFGSIFQKEDGSIGFDPKKGLKALDVPLGEGGVGTIKKMFSWKLPTIDIRYGSGKNDVIQFGRNADGSRMEGHLGKQLLELGGYTGLNSAIRTIYNKMTPEITETWKQLAQSSPSDFGSFPVNPAYRQGKLVPWKGKKGLGQVVERGKEVLKTAIPFSVRGGMKKWLSSAFGAFPISKETSLFKSTPAIENALKDPNKKRGDKKIAAIKEKLRENNVFEDKINSRISSVRSQIFRDKYLKNVEKVLKTKDPVKRERLIASLKKKMASDSLDMSKRSIDGIFKSTIKRLKEDGFFTKAYAEELIEQRKARKGRRRRVRRTRKTRATS